jgi:hypothetical protein
MLTSFVGGCCCAAAEKDLSMTPLTSSSETARTTRKFRDRTTGPYFPDFIFSFFI